MEAQSEEPNLDEIVQHLSRDGAALKSGEMSLTSSIHLDFDLASFGALLTAAAEGENEDFMTGFCFTLNDFIFYHFEMMGPDQVNELWRLLALLAKKIPNEQACAGFCLGVSHLVERCKAQNYHLMGDHFRYFLAQETNNLKILASLYRSVYPWVNFEPNAFYANVIAVGLSSENFLLYRIDMIKMLDYFNIEEDVFQEIDNFAPNFWGLLFEITQFTKTVQLENFWDIFGNLCHLSQTSPALFSQGNPITASVFETYLNPSVPLYSRIYHVLQLVYLSPFHSNDQFLQIMHSFSDIFIEYFETIGPLTFDLMDTLINIWSRLSFSNEQFKLFLDNIQSSYEEVGPPAFFLFSLFGSNRKMPKELSIAVLSSFSGHCNEMNIHLVVTCSRFLIHLFYDLEAEELPTSLLSVLESAFRNHIPAACYFFQSALEDHFLSPQQTLALAMDSFTSLLSAPSTSLLPNPNPNNLEPQNNPENPGLLNSDSELTNPEFTNPEFTTSENQSQQIDGESHEDPNLEFTRQLDMNIMGDDEASLIRSCLNLFDKNNQDVLQEAWTETVFPAVVGLIQNENAHPDLRVEGLVLLSHAFRDFQYTFLDESMLISAEVGLPFAIAITNSDHYKLYSNVLFYCIDALTVFDRLEKPVFVQFWTIYTQIFTAFMNENLPSEDCSFISHDIGIFWYNLVKKSRDDFSISAFLNSENSQLPEFQEHPYLVYHPTHMMRMLIDGERAREQESMTRENGYFQACRIMKMADQYQMIPELLELGKISQNGLFIKALLDTLEFALGRSRFASDFADVLPEIDNFIVSIVFGRLAIFGGKLPIFQKSFLPYVAKFLEAYFRIFHENEVERTYPLVAEATAYMAAAVSKSNLFSILSMMSVPVHRTLLPSQSIVVCHDTCFIILGRYCGDDFQLAAAAADLLLLFYDRYSCETFVQEYPSIVDHLKSSWKIKQGTAREERKKRKMLLPLILAFCLKEPRMVNKVIEIIQITADIFDQNPSVFREQLRVMVDSILKLFPQIQDDHIVKTAFARILMNVMISKYSDDEDDELTYDLIGQKLHKEATHLLRDYLVENPRFWEEFKDAHSPTSSIVLALINKFPELSVD